MKFINGAHRTNSTEKCPEIVSQCWRGTVAKMKNYSVCEQQYKSIHIIFSRGGGEGGCYILNYSMYTEVTLKINLFFMKICKNILLPLFLYFNHSFSSLWQPANLQYWWNFQDITYFRILYYQLLLLFMGMRWLYFSLYNLLFLTISSSNS